MILKSLQSVWSQALPQGPTIGRHIRCYSKARPHTEETPGYTPKQLMSAYNWPDPTTAGGKGTIIGILSLGGGTRTADLALAGVDPKRLHTTLIQGAANNPDDTNPSTEVELDVQTVGRFAPHASITNYIAPNTSQGFAGVLQQAISDAKAKRLDVLSISWGGPDDTWTPSDISAINGLLGQLYALGVPITGANGDNSVTDNTGAAMADFPSSSPYVLACGGTTLRIEDGHPEYEWVWNNGAAGGATGGAISTLFPPPLYQRNCQAIVSGAAAGIPLTGRASADVAFNADPQTGVQIFQDGQMLVVGGTSFAAPAWAALLACIKSGGADISNIHTKLYAHADAFFASIKGNNSAYNDAGQIEVRGYAQRPAQYGVPNGLGTPNGNALYLKLKAS